MNNETSLVTFWEYVWQYNKYRCPYCYTDAPFQVVKEGEVLIWRLELYCPHCGKRLHNPNIEDQQVKGDSHD